jgi:hypothetical protein
MFRNIFGTKYINKVGFEDILKLKPGSTILINTLPLSEQSYLIKNTTGFDNEENIINQSMKDDCQLVIIIYGKNSLDGSIEEKYSQLKSIGYTENKLYIYYGGLFEWCMLQDVFGVDNFESIGKCIDILKYKPKLVLV